MNAKLKRLSVNTFVRHNATAFVGAVTVAALNYLYYPVLGRLMHPADFGEVQAINSIFLQSVVFMSVFSVVIVSLVNKYQDPGEQRRLLAELEKVAGWIALAVMLGLLMLSPWLAEFFRFSSTLPLLLLLISLALSVPTTFRTAYLQGRRDFFNVSFTGVVAAGGKIIFSAALVIIGWNVVGAVFGTVIAQIITLLVLVNIVKRRGWLRPGDFRRVSLPDLRLVKPELRFAGLVLLTTLSFNVLLSLDILAVKHYFPPTVAGLYGGIETLSRIVFFINISVAGVLLPSVTPHLKPADRRRLLGQSALLTIGLGAAVLLSFWIAPRLIVTVLMGPKFLPFANLLPRLGLFTFLASIVNLLISYYLAQRRPLIAPAVMLGLGTTIGIVVMHHAVPAEVVTSLISGALCTLAWIFVLRWLSRRWRPLRSL